MSDSFFIMHKLADLIQSHNCENPECCCDKILSSIFTEEELS